MFGNLPLLLNIALRNIWLYRFRTIVTAGLLAFGSFLAVVGLSLLKEIESSMQESITGSVAGHLQIYSKKAKDDLALFGSSFMGRTDIGTIDDLAPVRDALMKHPNVAAVIPMGGDMAMLGRGNEMDDSLDALRAGLRSGDSTLISDRVDQVRFILQQLRAELAERQKLSSDQEEIRRWDTALTQAESPGFLDSGQTLDESKLQFLETKVAPLSGDKSPIYLNYIGTDIELFTKNFSKFRIVEGNPLPPGHRGILISQKIREDFLKNLVGRLFDKLSKRVDVTGIPIAGDPENERNAADLARQHAQIINFLNRPAAEQMSRELRDFGIVPSEDGAGSISGLTSQIKAFLKVDDANLRIRFDWFYAHIAPKIRMYEISPGETIVLRSYTRSGYVKSVPLKVYGVYAFSGLENSDLAGALNLVDLVSFRELFGQMNDAARKELEQMRAAIGIKQIDAADAEAALFGDEAPATFSPPAEAATSAPVTVLKIDRQIQDQFELGEIRKGLALNAAIVLKDPSTLRRTTKELEGIISAENLPYQFVDWQQASGIVGQFVLVVRLALIFAVIVIFVVALVIINNSIIVSALNRVREIGTMRAIGAQRSFVTGLFLSETGITGFVGALVGTLAAAIVLLILGSRGIPAVNDVVSFLFSGPKLFPKLHGEYVVLMPPLITLLAVVTSVFAARHASQIKPAEAMQEKE